MLYESLVKMNKHFDKHSRNILFKTRCLNSDCAVTEMLRSEGVNKQNETDRTTKNVPNLGEDRVEGKLVRKKP